MRVRHAMTALFVAVALCSLGYAASTITVDMGHQYDIGYSNPQSEGPAIYKLNAQDNVSFGSEGGEGFARLTMGAPTGWHYMYLDTILAGLGAIDLSAPGSGIEFDARIFQGPNSNTNPYNDANIFFRAYTYVPGSGGYEGGSTLTGYKDWGIVTAVAKPGGDPNDPTFNDPPYPEWTHVMIENLGGGGLNPASITRIRWYGTDWSGTGGDFFDIKNVVFRSGPAAPPIPEPATMSLLLIGALPLAKRLRRR
ncbi:MAG TPA: hypothetical protein PKK84_00690 [Armatimonadota bacterium]|jgi:hypothetical protein|nr:hypothetical protein [Armatimonadota bacterium]